MIETTSTARTLTGRKCYENGPPKSAIVSQVGFVWSTMLTFAGWRVASLDVVITFLPSWATVGVWWRKAVLRRVVFICEKCLLSSSTHRSGSTISLPAAETADLRILSMHLHITLLHYTSSDNNHVQTHKKWVVNKSIMLVRSVVDRKSVVSGAHG